MEDRIKALEAELQEVKGQQSALTAAVTAATPPPAAPAPEQPERPQPRKSRPQRQKWRPADWLLLRRHRVPCRSTAEHRPVRRKYLIQTSA